MDKTISVFGCGWLGFPLAKKLVKENFVVKGSTTSLQKIELLESAQIQPYLLSLENLSKNIDAFLSADILVVNIPSKNSEGFKSFIKKVENSTIKKVLFVSSTSVYSTSPNIVTEETALRDCPLKEIEELFQRNNNFETTILRFSGLLGYERKPGNWFKNGRIIPNPEGVVNMIHQDDCIEIIVRIIANKSWNQTFNAAADSHPKRRDFYTKAFLEVGRSTPIFNENDGKSLKVIGNKKVKEQLNFEFKYPDLMKLPQD